MASTKQGNTVVWGLTALLALVFLLAASGKVTGNAQAVEGFHRDGLSDSFRLFVGVAEIVGALGLLVPAAASLAGTGLALVMVGATVIHLAHGEAPHALVTAVLCGLLLFVAQARRGAIGRLLGADAAQ